MAQALARAQRGEPVRFDLTGLTREGPLAVVDVFFGPQLEDGSVKRIIATAVDVARRSREAAALAALQAFEAKFAGILNIADEAIITIDAEGRIVLFNQGAEKIFGYAAAEVLGRPLDGLLPGRLAAAHRTHVAAFGAGPEVSRAMGIRSRPIEGRRKDGTVFPAEASITKLQLPEGVFFTAILRDITERRHTEEALRESEERLRQAVRAGNIGIFDRDHERNTIYWSPELRAIVGWPADEPAALDKYLAQVIPEDRERLAAAMQRTIDPAGDGVIHYEYRIVDRHGALHWLSVRGRTIFAGEGAARRPVRTTGAVADVTERRRAEQERAALEAQLRQSQKLEAVGTLAGGIAHDFNNILTGILGYAHLAEARLPNGPDPRECVHEIALAARRGADLVQQLLAFSRRQPQERTVIALADVVRDTAKLLRPVLPASLELQLELPASSPRVLANATQVEQVLLNLCTNARQALGVRPGRIALRLDTVEIGAEQARAVPGLRPGRHARLTVADNGPGISHATLERIFEPFFTTKPPGEGSGLGLAVVHGIVRSHDGAVTVASELGAGTVFTLYFPAHEKLVAAPPPAPPSPAHGHGEHILFVDDEPSLVDVGRELLVRLGYRVTAHIDPLAALAAFRAAPEAFDAAVLDVAMPALTGLDLARHLSEAHPDLPIVIMSGHPDAIPPAELAHLRVREVLAKPAVVDTLGESLARIFAGSPRRHAGRGRRPLTHCRAFPFETARKARMSLARLLWRFLPRPPFRPFPEPSLPLP